MIQAGYLLPHPPIIIPEVGGDRAYDAQDTIKAMEEVASQIKDLEPETIIVITPHGPSFTDAMALYSDPSLKGHLGAFNHPELTLEKENDEELLDELIFTCFEKNIPVTRIDDSLVQRFSLSRDLDHGVQVPLYFIDQVYRDYKVVCISYGFLSSDELYRLGMVIKESITQVGRKAVVIASGDLSHRLKDDGPYTFHPDGDKFDRQILSLLQEGRFEEVIEMNEGLCKNAGECGKRSIDVLLGTLDGYQVDIRQHSYEGPFGVGYGVVGFTNPQADANQVRLHRIQEMKVKRLQDQRAQEDLYVQLARRAIEAFVKDQKKIEVPDLGPDDLRTQRAGTFVSIKTGGGLRGCMGTISGTEINLGEEIIANAIKAATGDPRFPEIEEDELDDLTITVDVLGDPEPVGAMDQLDPQNYGVIVTKDYRRGLLLPDLDGIDTAYEQVTIALNKAGIEENEDYTIERFKVVRHY